MKKQRQIKLSPKQKEVMLLLKNGKGHKLHWLSGIRPSCFMSHDIRFKVSTATTLKLAELGLVKADNEMTLNRTYLLTELGKTIEL